MFTYNWDNIFINEIGGDHQWPVVPHLLSSDVCGWGRPLPVCTRARRVTHCSHVWSTINSIGEITPNVMVLNCWRVDTVRTLPTIRFITTGILCRTQISQHIGARCAASLSLVQCKPPVWPLPQWPLRHWLWNRNRLAMELAIVSLMMSPLPVLSLENGWYSFFCVVLLPRPFQGRSVLFACFNCACWFLIVSKLAFSMNFICFFWAKNVRNFVI